MLLFSYSVMSDSATPCTATHQASLSFNTSRSLLKLSSIDLVITSNHLILCHRLLLLPSVFPSFRVWVGASHRVAKVLELQLQNQSFQRIFRGDFPYDWFDLLAVQGTLESLLQRPNLKASVVQCLTFLMVQLSHPHMTTGNRNALWTSNPTTGHTHWGNQNWKRHVYPNVHHSIVYNSQDMEAT